MTDTANKNKNKLRNIRLSLKYRPKIFNLILKMRQCIRKRNSVIKSLKHRLKQMDKISENKITEYATIKVNLKESPNLNQNNSISLINSQTKVKDIQIQTECDKRELPTKEIKLKVASTQTKSKVKNLDSDIIKTDAPDKSTNPCDLKEESPDEVNVDAGWNVKENGEVEKSIAEQVKEAAQSALQDNGMVYVESAGMYYDYKTGYYYNSELGLYYHTDTGCYYCYSEDKQFVFHSYPDMSNVNSSLIAHQKKKARKLKREIKPDADIENLTKDLSQDLEEDATKPKHKKIRKVKKEKREKKKDKKKKEKVDGEKQDIENGTYEASDKVLKEEKKETEHSNAMEVDILNDESKMVDPKMETEMAPDNVELEVPKDNEVKKEQKGSDSADTNDSELEDGECSETESEESSSDEESNASTVSMSDDDSVAKQHPPCMRVIVRETKLPKLKVGSLFLITKDGGSIGREGSHHAILISDQNISRNHLDIKYDMTRKTYVAMDLGSKNGTILNGCRMSESLEISDAMDILHGSTIQLGETKLLCHVHPGHATCGQCEPGLLIEAEEQKKVAYTRTCSVKKQYHLELARLKNLYAPQCLAIEETAYNDRAQNRRETVGSTHDAEKTQSADLDRCISSENKGFKLLEKMGWSKGEGLGKDSQGETEPVPLLSNEGKAGLGKTGAVSVPSTAPKPINKNRITAGTLRLAARTKMLQPPAKAFQSMTDEDY